MFIFPSFSGGVSLSNPVDHNGRVCHLRAAALVDLLDDQICAHKKCSRLIKQLDMDMDIIMAMERLVPPPFLSR